MTLERRIGPDLPGWVDVDTAATMLDDAGRLDWGARCVVAMARAFDGWNWREHGAGFATLIYPNDTPAHARQLAPAQSQCALWGATVLRYAGADDAELWAPYWGRSDAVSLLERLARRHEVWRTPESDGEPGLGALVRIGAQRPDGTPDPRYVRGQRATEHVSCVVDMGPGPGGGDLVHGVDGGQVHDGNGSHAILLRSRRIERVQHELWWGHTVHGRDATGRPLVGRRVVGWVDVPAYPRPRAARVPEAFARGDDR